MTTFGVWRWNDAKGGMRFAFPPYGLSDWYLEQKTVKTNMLNAGVDKVHRDLILGHSLQANTRISALFFSRPWSWVLTLR